jgi:exonuclease VII small subunit
MACARLSIDNLENFEDSLDKIEKVIRLIPQMEIFISEVEQLVSNLQNKFMNLNESKSMSSTLKLNQLLSVIKSWAKSMEEYADLKVKS